MSHHDISQRPVLILGFGEMGHAFAALLEGRHPYRIWCRSEEQAGHVQLETLAAAAGVIILCLPVMAHEAIARRLAAVLAADTLCVSIAKGVDEQGRSAAQILQACLPTQPLALIYGPMISEEIVVGRPAFAQLAVTRPGDSQALLAMFRDSGLHLWPADDIPGISWSVILKNVYALLFGMADELSLGDNTRGFLMVESLRELSAIVTAMGGEAQTPYQLAGLGDLTTTATSESSHHHELGRRLARGEEEGIRGEGVHTLQRVYAQRLFPLESYPLFRLCHHVLLQPGRCRELFTHYLDALDPP